MGGKSGKNIQNFNLILMNFKIIDAHAHLWLRQDTEVEGKAIRTLSNGKSLFMGEIRQMLPPFMTDGRNTAEIFLSNMDYAQVSAAVITQEYIDGLQNDYLWEVQQKYPDRFFCCGMVDARQPGYFEQGKQLIEQGFRAVKIPAQRLVTVGKKIYLTSDEMMRFFQIMEENNILFSVDLAEGEEQMGEMNEIIAEYPKLKIAIGHFGMVTRPGWQEQIKLARHPNVCIESGGITWLFNDEFYPFKGAVQAIQEAAELVGWDKLMWGSDYPRTITAITYRMSYDFVLKSALLSAEEKAQFLGLNAEKFYGFTDLVTLPYMKNMSE
jgi:predicted TIM-barrel fold metal-dependent hydrolase